MAKAQSIAPTTRFPIIRTSFLLLLLLLFLTFSVLVANPKKLLYTVANPAHIKTGS